LLKAFFISSTEPYRSIASVFVYGTEDIDELRTEDTAFRAVVSPFRTAWTALITSSAE